MTAAHVFLVTMGAVGYGNLAPVRVVTDTTSPGNLVALARLAYSEVAPLHSRSPAHDPARLELREAKYIGPCYIDAAVTA